MSTVFGILILIIWTYLVMAINWDSESSVSVNVIVNLVIIGLLGVIYWLPFWLIFMK